MADDAIEALPAAPSGRVEDWSLPELLTEGARLGLMRLREIASWELDPDDMKKSRLIADVGLGLGKLLMRAQEGELRREALDRWPEMMRAIEAARAERPAIEHIGGAEIMPGADIPA